MDHTALRGRLDGLIAEYLSLLDQQQAAQKQLAKHFSAGYFAIAQANFAAPSSIRYGQDYYDQRMQASRRAYVEETDSVPEIRILFETIADGIETSKDEDVAPQARIESTSTISDPIRWFGILVPPALRSAQRHFVAGLETEIPSVLNISHKMKRLESEIMQSRKQLKDSDDT